MKIPGRVKSNLPKVALRLLEAWASRRTPKGTMVKVLVLVILGTAGTAACKVTLPAPPPGRLCGAVAGLDCACYAFQGVYPIGQWVYQPCVEPSPSPSPVPSPSPIVEPSLPPPSPSPAPSSSPSPSPAPTAPPPLPCVEASPRPLCREGCVSCAEWIAGALAGEDWRPLPGNPDLIFNPAPGLEGRDCIYRKSCDLVWCSNGELRAHRLQKDGSVCEAGCARMAPTPCPPSPPPSAPPSSPVPSPSGAPPIDASGNYPMPAEGVCPAWFRDAVAYVGINVMTQRKCQGKDAPADCTLTVLNATEKSRKPFCPHAADRLECETWRPCQQPAVVNGNEGVQMLIASPQWGGTFGACDKQTTDGPFPDSRLNFLCHDRAENRPGVTLYKACEPDGTKCGPVKEYRSLP